MFTSSRGAFPELMAKACREITFQCRKAEWESRSCAVLCLPSWDFRVIWVCPVPREAEGAPVRCPPPWIYQLK